MKCFGFLASALALLLAFPAAGAYAAAVDYNIVVVAVGSVERETISHARAAAEVTAAYLEANGISVFRSVPKTVKLYGTADLFLEGMREGGLFGDPVDEENFAETKDGWRKTSGTISRGSVHINTAAFDADDDTVLAHVIAHEFVHVIQYETSGYSRERDHSWLVEGTAELAAFAVTELLAGGTGNFAHGIGKILGNLAAQKALPALSVLADREAFDSAIGASGKDAHKIVYGVSTLGTWYLLIRTRKPLKSLFDYMAAFRLAETEREAIFGKTFGFGTDDFYTHFDKYIVSIGK